MTNQTKPKEVSIVWDSAIGLGIDYSPLTARDIGQSRWRWTAEEIDTWNWGGIEPGVDRVKRWNGTRFTICTTETNVLHWLCCSSSGSFCTSWLTDVSCSQRWVIYSQTKDAVSNYTYLFRCVWFVVVFSDLFFYLSLCFLTVMFSELYFFFFCICIRNLLFCFQNRDMFCTSRLPYYWPRSVYWTIEHGGFSHLLSHL